MKLLAIAYAPDMQSFYVTRMHPYARVRVTRDGDSERMWEWSRTWVTSPLVSPDGRRLIFMQQVREEDVFMLEEP